MLGHVFDSPAVVEPVGELDQNHTDIIVESQKDALEVFRLETLGINVVLLVPVLVVEHSLDLG